jgi:cytochrome c-type biogenesis protein CcmF
LAGIINTGDRKFLRAINSVPALPKAQQARALDTIFQLRDRLIGDLVSRWITHPWPAQFLILVSPLVTWLWFGAIIAACGGLIALWPVPRRRRGRGVGSATAARGRREREATPAPAAAERPRELV